MAQRATGGTRAQRLPLGDPLRGLAAVGVLLFHAPAFSLLAAQHYELLKPPIDYRDSFGAVSGHLLNHLNGLPLFFALSGYLIARPFAAWVIADGRSVAIPNYLRNRALRILPAFWLVLAVVVAVKGKGLDAWAVARTASLWIDWVNSPFRGLLGQAWTLTVEVRYYLLVPVVSVLGVVVARRLAAPPRVRAAVALALLVAGGLASALAESGRVPPMTTFTLRHQFFAFVPGIALAVVEALQPWAARDPFKLRRLGLWIAVAGTIVFLTIDQFTLASLGLEDRSARLIGDLAVAAGAGGIVAGGAVAAWGGGGRWRTLDTSILRWAGTRSYSIYLWHWVVLVELFGPLRMGDHYQRSTAVLALVSLAVTLMLAEGSYRLVERPCLDRKRGYGRTNPPPRTSRPTQLGPPRAVHDHARSSPDR